MTALAPAIQTFLTRTVQGLMGTRNVTLVITGDFNRSLPGSDHQPNNTALVIGKNVKNGTTAKTDAKVASAPGTPSVDGFWQYLAALTKTDGNPFGANPHTGLVT